MIPRCLTGRRPKLCNCTCTQWILNLPTVLSLLDALTGLSNWYKKGEISDLNFTVCQFSVLNRYITVSFVYKGWLGMYKMCKECVAEKGHPLNCEGGIKYYGDHREGNTFLFAHWRKVLCGRGDKGYMAKDFCHNVYAEDEWNKSWQSVFCQFWILEYSILQPYPCFFNIDMCVCNNVSLICNQVTLEMNCYQFASMLSHTMWMCEVG